MVYQNIDIIHRLKEAGVRITSEETPQKNMKLTGLEFVITGKLESSSRPEAEERIRILGGTAKGSITRNTTYLVVGEDPGSSKLTQAEKWGTLKITEDQLLRLLEGKEIWRHRTGSLITQPTPVGDKLYFGSEDGYFRCINLEGKELWRFAIDGLMWDIPSYHKGKIIFGTWSCHVHTLDALTGKEVWRFTTSNTKPSPLDPPYSSFRTEIKKSTHVDETVKESKYKKKKEETVSLSDYHVTSEYSATSEYKTKSDYDVSLVMFEDIMEVERIWTSDLKPQDLM